MFRFARTTAAVTVITLTASLYSVTSASAFNPGVRHHAPVHHGHHGMRHHGGGGYGRAMAIGAGVGLGLMLLNAAVQAQQAQQARPVEVVREPRQPKQPVAKRAPKIEPPAEITIRTAHPIYVTPKLPDVQKQDCNNANCDQLWQSIVHYKSIIFEDSRKLAERKAEVINRQNRSKEHTTAAGKAKTKADRDYHNEMARIEKTSANQLEDDNMTLANLIKEEERILQDRIAQYEDCVKRACAGQQVGAAPAAVTPR